MENEVLIKQVRQTYIDFFHSEPLLVASPGRVNIIGEHTDYNEGFVLPAAINKYAFVAIGRRNDSEIHLYSLDFDEMYVTSLDTMQKEEGKWTNYILGVVAQLVKHQYRFGGFNLVVGGNVPIGAGMSSSAAIECAVIKATSELFGLSIDDITLAKLAQKAEHEYAGVQCGIMDQFASVFGKKNCAIRLDCRSLNYELVPLDLKGFKIVLFNTNVKHSLASSEYNKRRQECETGVEWIRHSHPHVTSLRDVNLEMINEYVLGRSEIIARRCKYVVEENARLSAACDALKEGNIDALGRLMFLSHEGLSKDYEVSCIELDLLVDEVRNDEAVAGARMMGGGFGGCTINIIREEMINEVSMRVARAYKIKTELDMETYIAETGDGAHRMRGDIHQTTIETQPEYKTNQS